MATELWLYLSLPWLMLLWAVSSCCSSYLSSLSPPFRGPFSGGKNAAHHTRTVLHKQARHHGMCVCALSGISHRGCCWLLCKPSSAVIVMRALRKRRRLSSSTRCVRCFHLSGSLQELSLEQLRRRRPPHEPFLKVHVKSHQRVQ